MFGDCTLLKFYPAKFEIGATPRFVRNTNYAMTERVELVHRYLREMGN